VRVPLDPDFRDEWQRFGLRFCCEDCAYLTREGECAHGWPQAEHRLARYADPSCRELVFCKEFELV